MMTPNWENSMLNDGLSCEVILVNVITFKIHECLERWYLTQKVPVPSLFSVTN